VDSAELFVFLAGWACQIYQGPARAAGKMAILRLNPRVQVYVAQMVAHGAGARPSRGGRDILDAPFLLDWHNASAVFNDPSRRISVSFCFHPSTRHFILPVCRFNFHRSPSRFSTVMLRRFCCLLRLRSMLLSCSA
jgi:hypothetical protein